jgi:hypothetical protein
MTRRRAVRFSFHAIIIPTADRFRSGYALHARGALKGPATNNALDNHPRRIKTMIDNKQIAKQMVEFNKTAFDNSFKAMTMVYEQNEKMLEAFLGQASWMPAEGRKALQDWMGSYKKGCQDFKKIVDDNYAKVEGFFSKGD